MLDHLNGYLRAALAAARKERNSLGDEFALLRGYLEYSPSAWTGA